MSEEEKKAIKNCDTIFMCLEDMMSEESADDYRSSYRLIKNLINNQQKEIERLNFENHMVKKWNEQLDKKCISKDKIREKIKKAKEIKWHTPKLVIEYFEELLEEN